MQIFVACNREKYLLKRFATIHFICISFDKSNIEQKAYYIYVSYCCIVYIHSFALIRNEFKRNWLLLFGIPFCFRNSEKYSQTHSCTSAKTQFITQQLLNLVTAMRTMLKRRDACLEIHLKCERVRRIGYTQKIP